MVAWGSFWAGFLVGTWVGAFVGIVTVSIMRVGAIEDERKRREKEDELSRLHL